MRISLMATRNLNSVSFSGNIAKIIANGKISILLAHKEEFEKDGEKREKTDFVWVRTTSKVFPPSTFKVGDLVVVRGKLSGGQYQDERGNWQNNLSIFAFSITSGEEDEENEALPTPDPEDLTVPSGSGDIKF
jgi:single-stranded DNA-binding protein